MKQKPRKMRRKYTFTTANGFPCTIDEIETPTLLVPAKYIIIINAGRKTVTLTRFNELYAGNGQVGFCLHEAYDGRWVNAAAAKTLNAEDTA